MVRIKVFDVDRKNIWDKITDSVSSFINAALGKGKDLASTIPVVGGSFGSVADEINSTIARKLAVGDKLLFQGSAKIQGATVTIMGRGSADSNQAGQYTIVLNHEMKG